METQETFVYDELGARPPKEVKEKIRKILKTEDGQTNVSEKVVEQSLRINTLEETVYESSLGNDETVQDGFATIILQEEEDEEKQKLSLLEEMKKPLFTKEEIIKQLEIAKTNPIGVFTLKDLIKERRLSEKREEEEKAPVEEEEEAFPETKLDLSKPLFSKSEMLRDLEKERRLASAHPSNAATRVSERKRKIRNIDLSELLDDDEAGRGDDDDPTPKKKRQKETAEERFKRPRGRQPIGKEWDLENGRWVDRSVLRPGN